jgi:hypothetical protein
MGFLRFPDKNLQVRLVFILRIYSFKILDDIAAKLQIGTAPKPL